MIRSFTPVVIAATLAIAATIYPKTAVVTSLDYTTDTVTVTDASGNSWEFAGCEDYCAGDVVSMIMENKGTEIIYDDEVISARYSGYTATELE